MEDVKREMRKLTKVQLVDKCAELIIKVDEMDDTLEGIKDNSRHITEDRDRNYQDYAASIQANNQLASTVHRQEKNIQTLIDVIRKKEGLDK